MNEKKNQDKKPKKRGRPKGSKNKPKITKNTTTKRKPAKKDLSKVPAKLSWEKAEKVLGEKQESPKKKQRKVGEKPSVAKKIPETVEVEKVNKYFPTEKFIRKGGELPDWVMDDLRKSGISDEYIKKMYVEPVLNNDQLSDLSISKTHNKQGILQATPCYFIPYLHVPNYARIKLQNALDGAKYVAPYGKGTIHLYYLPEQEKNLGKTKIQLWITEGEKKGVALQQELDNQGDGVAVACPGVGVWLNTPELNKISFVGRTVNLVYDNFENHPHVQAQVLSWIIFLEKKGASPSLIILPKNLPNIDDFLCKKKLDDLKFSVKVLENLTNVTEKNLASCFVKHNYSQQEVENFCDKYKVNKIFGLRITTLKKTLKEQMKLIRESSENKQEEVGSNEKWKILYKKYKGQEGIFMVTDSGIFKEIKLEDGYGEKIYKQILYQTVQVVEVRRDLTSGETTVVLTWPGAKEHAEVPYNAVSFKTDLKYLGKLGIRVNDSNASDVVNYFAEALKDHLIEKSFVTKNGWLNRKESFVCGNMIVRKDHIEDIAYEGNLYKASKNGDEKIQMEILDNWQYDLEISCLLGASAISPFIEEIGCQNFILHLYGGSKTGKTFAAELAIALWGNPEALGKKWDSTEVGCELYFSEAGGMPCFLDEIAQAKDPSFVEKIAYTFGNGKGRTRGSSSKGSVQAANIYNWKCGLISTGEYKINEYSNEGGVESRIIQIYRKEQDKTALKRMQEQYTKIYANNGHFGYKIMQFHMNNRNWIREKYNKILTHLADHGSALDATKKQFYACVITGLCVLEEIGVPCYDSHEAMKELNSQMAEETTLPTWEKALNYISDAVASKIKNFDFKSDDDDDRGSYSDRISEEKEIYGVYNEKTGVVCFIPKILNKILDEGGFKKSILRTFREKSILLCDGKRYTKNTWFTRVGRSIPMNSIKVFNRENENRTQNVHENVNEEENVNEMFM